jgi:hypothetical protein
MMRRWSFYDLTTGEFAQRRYSAPDDTDLERNTPAGHGAIEGRYDPLTQLVDIGNPAEIEIAGQWRRVVVDWANTKLIDGIGQREAVRHAQSRIAELEGRQARAMREDRLRPNERDRDGKLARERLQEIDDEIAALRATINGETDTSARPG